MKFLLVLILIASSASAQVELLSYTRSGNRVDLRLSEGRAEIEWISTSTFRFARFWSVPATPPTSAQRELVPFKLRDSGSDLELQTEFVEVAISKRGLLVRAKTTGGIPLIADLCEVQKSGEILWWEREAPPSARYFGLGPRSDSDLSLRGKLIRTQNPFLLSTRGYGEYHTAGGTFSVDVAKSRPDRYRIQSEGASHIEYYFYFGPSLKEIFEQHLLVTGPVRRLAVDQIGVLPLPRGQILLAPPATWKTLADSVAEIVNSSLSGVLLPEFSLDAYADSEPALKQRAEQLATFVPLRRGGQPSAFRRQLVPFLLTYVEEARERGYPVVHALPFQFPHDPEAARHGDQFLFGDELLIAPVITPDGTRSVYIPQGIWTEFHTGRIFRGRQTIEYHADPSYPPIFCRNGTIVPLAGEKSGAPMQLHYFPQLGAEFFIFESDLEDYSQVHASPAGEYVRLEIESKKTRDYEWVLHHAGPPSMVSVPNWHYDAERNNLHVLCTAGAGEDKIINLSVAFRPTTGGVAPQSPAEPPSNSRKSEMK